MMNAIVSVDKSVDKVVITNIGALLAKYGPAGLAAIQAAIATLIVHDKKRGLSTLVVAVDSAADMAVVGGVAVARAADQKGNKDAVDAIYGHHSPDYLMMLGAPDIIPHQDLTNPVYSPGTDDDQLVPSDLPYACNAVYGITISDFIGPTRVIGRLPDLNGIADLNSFVNLIRRAGAEVPASAATYQSVFGLTAEVWQTSTKMSIAGAFGSGVKIHVSPPEGPAWTSAELAPRSHFINCHGGSTDPKFYGQLGTSYPIAHKATNLPGKTVAGTVVAAECCYGAQLYPVPAAGGQAGICSTYLNCGAVAFYGSTTIAYGPATTNDWADLLCQYFFSGILAGLSTGHAALAAVQHYIVGKPIVDPTSLKTIAQFLLLSDPSVCPVIAPSAKSFGSAPSADSAMPESLRKVRQLRRQVLEQQGVSLGLTKAYARVTVDPTADALSAQVARIVNIADFTAYSVIGSFDVVQPPGAANEVVLQKSPAGQRVHLWGKRNKVADNAKIVDIHLIVGLETGGQLILVSQAHSR